jgi:hypothetical protein
MNPLLTSIVSVALYDQRIDCPLLAFWSRKRLVPSLNPLRSGLLPGTLSVTDAIDSQVVIWI